MGFWSPSLKTTSKKIGRKIEFEQKAGLEIVFVTILIHNGIYTTDSPSFQELKSIKKSNRVLVGGGNMA